MQTKLLVKQIDLNIINKFVLATPLVNFKPISVKIGFFFGLNIAVSLFAVLLYFSTYISPSYFWPSAFLPLLIPPIILINFIFMVIWLFRYPKRSLLSLIVLIIGYSFISRTFSIHFLSQAKEDSAIRILSYNVRVFNSYNHLKDKDFASSKKMMAWVARHPAEIICLQEFFNLESDSIFNAVERIRRRHPYYNFKTFFINRNKGASLGMAIFSKLPIIKKGMLNFKEKTNNQVLYADIKTGKDTIRIYNMHLQSMSLTEEEIADIRNLKSVLKKLREGSIQRSLQIKVLNDHIEKCPFKKIIICGDLNDTPYSYSYQTLRRKFDNSFEKAGNGFGWTYNGKLFLRIDNQFSSKAIPVTSFKVNKEIKYSDHFPIEGIYSLN